MLRSARYIFNRFGSTDVFDNRILARVVTSYTDLELADDLVDLVFLVAPRPSVVVYAARYLNALHCGGRRWRVLSSF